MSYDVKGLEVLAELLHRQDRDDKQQLEVVSPVHRRRYGVYVEILAELETVALEREFAGVDLGSETAVA